MIDRELLEILACPETGEPLVEADPDLVRRLNGMIELGTLVDRSGKPVSRKMEGGLVPRGRGCLYPVREDIPVLLVEESVPLPAAASRNPPRALKS